LEWKQGGAKEKEDHQYDQHSQMLNGLRGDGPSLPPQPRHLATAKKPVDTQIRIAKGSNFPIILTGFLNFWISIRRSLVVILKLYGDKES
jgi:hypothetical protein